MNVIASHDQFKLIRIRENSVVNYIAIRADSVSPQTNTVISQHRVKVVL